MLLHVAAHVVHVACAAVRRNVRLAAALRNTRSARAKCISDERLHGGVIFFSDYARQALIFVAFGTGRIGPRMCAVSPRRLSCIMHWVVCGALQGVASTRSLAAIPRMCAAFPRMFAACPLALCCLCLYCAYVQPARACVRLPRCACLPPQARLPHLCAVAAACPALCACLIFRRMRAGCTAPEHLHRVAATHACASPPRARAAFPRTLAAFAAHAHCARLPLAASPRTFAAFPCMIACLYAF
jgi:hypothetical protein